MKGESVRMRKRKKLNSVIAGRDAKSQLTLQMMVLPAIVVTVLMSYLPMYGITIAFKNYNIFLFFPFWK